jgi:hypothetical protein
VSALLGLGASALEAAVPVGAIDASAAADVAGLGGEDFL